MKSGVFLHVVNDISILGLYDNSDNSIIVIVITLANLYPSLDRKLIYQNMAHVRIHIIVI